MRSTKLALICAALSIVGILGGASGDVAPVAHPGALGGGVTWQRQS